MQRYTCELRERYGEDAFKCLEAVIVAETQDLHLRIYLPYSYRQDMPAQRRLIVLPTRRFSVADGSCTNKQTNKACSVSEVLHL